MLFCRDSNEPVASAPRNRGGYPRHITVRHDGRLVGALPCYEKYNSYGEFIFDWSWAHAASRSGIPYYPKLVAAVPFTPATGERLLLAGDLDPTAQAAVADLLVQGALELAQTIQASSIHLLFCQPRELPYFTKEGFAQRRSYQFHWQREPHWQTFADFTAELRSPSRKQVRRERATAASHGLRLAMRRGNEMGQAEWAALYAFYRTTTHEKGAVPYLTESFFHHMQRALPERVVAAMAYSGDEPVAGALYLTKGTHLYGRYWGSLGEYDALHFELCYYAPIEWALAHGITRFEAGAQGEHKLKRGLLPSACHSAHWLRHPGLAHAVGEFVIREAAAIDEEMVVMASHSPFRRGAGES